MFLQLSSNAHTTTVAYTFLHVCALYRNPPDSGLSMMQIKRVYMSPDSDGENEDDDNKVRK